VSVFEKLAHNKAFGLVSTAQPGLGNGDTAEGQSDAFTDLFNECLAGLEDDYKDGTRSFIRDHYPELHEMTENAWVQIETTWGNDLPEFKQALNQFRILEKQALKLFGEANHETP